MYYDNLPIFKSTLNLVVYIETIVKNFEKYHQYTIGVDLSTHSKEMLFLINRAIYEELKGAMRLAEIKVFLSVQASFASHTKHVPDRRDKCPWGAKSYNLMKKR